MAQQSQENDIPVYLFTGFLEAGKTKFIQETLEDKRFNKGERTLLLLCEEGEEEYDISLFPYQNVYQRVLEDISELNPQHLQQLQEQCRAQRVIIEYNGMWQLPTLFNSIPDNWTVYQEMFFADATTFLNYNANMRSLVVDKLNTCELVIFNRFQPNMEQMEFHKIVRAVSRRTDIAYEYADGKVEYDQIQDPLPFDITADVIVIEDKDYALWYRDLMEEPKKYDGKTVKFKGIVARDRTFPQQTFAIGRHVMTCCAEDITYHCVVAQWSGAETLQSRQWIWATGTIKLQKHKLYRGKGPVLYIKTVAMTTKPQQEVATFY